MIKASDVLAAALNDGRHLNAWGLAKWAREQELPDVYIDYNPAQPGRAYRSASYSVVRPGFETDPGSHWADHGNKTFHVFGSDAKDRMFFSAKIWCLDRFGLDPERWVKVSGVPGAWFPMEVANEVKARIRAWRKEQKHGRDSHVDAG